MNLETLDDMWQKDAILDDEKLDKDSLAIPKLHAKYLRIYNSFCTLRDQQEVTIKKSTVTGGNTIQGSRRNHSTLNSSRQMYQSIWNQTENIRRQSSS